MSLKITICFITILYPLVHSWTQQYGDPGSTSYVEYHGIEQQASTGWNITVQTSGTSPSVSKDGVLFYPLVGYIIALNPNGKILWSVKVSALERFGYLSNSVYSERHGLVVVGALISNSYQIVALKANSGNIVWKSVHREVMAPQTLSISTVVDAVYVASNKTVIALNVDDGSLLWNSTQMRIGVLMQTKVGAQASKEVSIENKELLLLPTDPYDGFHGKGRLFAYKTVSNQSQWHTDIGFTAGALFAFSGDGTIFGVSSGRGAIFGIDSANGHIIFNSKGYCPLWVSGPAVDNSGYAYYSCGNRLYSVYKNGSLRWISKKYGETPANLGVLNPPSIHPHGYIYFIHSNHTKVLALSAADGTLLESYEVPEMVYSEPPILLGDTMMYLSGYTDDGSTMIVSVEL